MAQERSDSISKLRILVAIANYGTRNDHLLKSVLSEYRSMSFDIDFVLMSNIDKQAEFGVETLVGLPTRDPWSMPFMHRKLFADRSGDYDLYIYTEDDMLVTEDNLRAFLDVSQFLRPDEVAGFLRIERGSAGDLNFPDVHGYFHWDPTSIRSRGSYTLARFTNEHAAFYVLTRDQLQAALASGGFLVDPHEGKYDLLCTAATDPYTQCGLTKLIPISHIDDFSIHHLSDRYVGKLGVGRAEQLEQINVMLDMAARKNAALPLFATESRLWRGRYSKDYHDAVAADIVSAIPPHVRSVLSIGCGAGGTEGWLAQRGLDVTALPLDPVIGSVAERRGVKMVPGDFQEAKRALQGQTFDCILYLDVLHLIPDPVAVLSLFSDNLAADAVVIIQTPNIFYLRALWRAFRRSRHLETWQPYEVTGVHRTTFRKLRGWCRASGLKVQQTIDVIRKRADAGRASLPDIIPQLFSPALIAVAQKATTAATPNSGSVK